MKGWPIRMWAVAYYDADKTPCWVPFSGELFHYRDEAERKARESKNSSVISVRVEPTGYSRRAAVSEEPSL